MLSSRDERPIEMVDDAVAAILRSMTPAERIEVVFNASRMARRLVSAGVRLRQPELSEAEVSRETARIFANGSS